MFIIYCCYIYCYICMNYICSYDMFPPAIIIYICYYCYCCCYICMAIMGFIPPGIPGIMPGVMLLPIPFIIEFCCVVARVLAIGGMIWEPMVD